LNRLLAETRGKYACGEAVTMADVFLFPQAMTSKRFAVDAERFPEIRSVVENLSALTPFHDSHLPGA
jgi:maleylacetoacetate isomerase